MLYNKEFKNIVLEYLKNHSQYQTAKKFKIGTNTIRYWTDINYKQKQDKRSLVYKNKHYKKLLIYSRKYNINRRKIDPEYVEKRNKDAKKWQKEKRKKDPEWNKHNIEISTKWHKTHKNLASYRLKALIRGRRRRAKKLKLNEIFTAEDQTFTFNLFEGKCAICGTTKKLEIDHWHPLSKGNPLTRENAVLLCKYCNCSKGNKEPNEHFTEIITNKIETKLTSK